MADSNAAQSNSQHPTGNGLVDVHSHFVNDAYQSAAIAAGIAHPDGMPDWPTWSVDAHLDLMDRSGTDIAMLSVSSPGVHFGDDAAARRLAREVNEYGADLVAGRPDRFGLFASLPVPDIDGSLTELTYALDELHADGFVIETNAHGMYLGDTRMQPLLAELDRRRAVVFVHPTSPPNYESVSLGRPRPMIEFIFDSARTVSDLIFAGTLVRYSGIRWIFTHGGGVLPLLADRMEMFSSWFPAKENPPPPPVSEQLAELWYDMAGTPFPHQIPVLTGLVGTDKVLYGSDYCWTPAGSVADQLISIDNAAPPTDAPDWRTLTTENARRMFPRLAAQPVAPDPKGQ
ncbi:amidohydrolase family protein [Streptomyces sp. x-80]|uniref:amidohydrolase family protein n=1 Tax=Streptomyces sp. x-80 TaxID=2789282 RepID=UPI00397FB106